MRVCVCVGCGGIEIRKYHNIELFPKLSFGRSSVYFWERYYIIFDHSTCTCM